MATAMATLSLSAAVPVSMASSAHFSGTTKIRMATPRVSRSSRVFVIRAEDNIVDKVKDAFGGAKKDADSAVSSGKSEANKAAGQAKGTSGNVVDDIKAQAEQAGDKVKGGIEDLQKKVEDATDQTKK